MGRGLDGYFFFFDTRSGCLCSFQVLPVRAVSRDFAVAIARGKHLFPFRTEQLSLSAPMVLGPQGPGRVGRRRFNSKGPALRGLCRCLRSVGALRVVARTRAARRRGAWRAERSDAVLRARRCRTGPARPEGGSQRLAVRMSSRLAGGPGRLEVVLPDRILEQYESAGGVGGTPEAVSPRGRRRPGIRG